MNFDQALKDLHAGRLSFDEFIRATRTRWQNLARVITRRWRMPPCVELEDVEQELLLSVWSCLWRFDETRGVSLTRFVVFNAVDRAKKQMHKVRGASYGGRGVDFNPSRFETPFSTWEEDGWLDALLKTEPEQLNEVARREHIARAEGVCESTRELYAVRALAETGSIAQGAQRIYENNEARLDCRLNSEDHAFRVVEKAAIEVADRLRAVA